VILGPERAPRALWLLLPAAALYGVALLAPLGVTLAYSVAKFDGGVTSFGLHADNYRAVLGGGAYLAIFLNTVRLAVIITAVCLVAGMVIALAIRRATRAARLLLIVMIASPLLTSVIVRNVAWLLVLGRSGMINDLLRRAGVITQPLPLMYNEFGVVLGVVHAYLTFMVLPIYGSLRAIDRSIEESAASLGASRMTVFRRVTLPLALPGVVAGCSIVFILSLGIFITPAILGGGFVVTMPMSITRLVRDDYNFPEAAALSVVLLAVILAVIATAGLVRRRWRQIV
jgi:putative spermidine/putrescine transport system permease protein